MKTMVRGAVFDPSGTYRYALTREWEPGAGVTFVMLNPSTADAQEDDPTIRKCIGFADRLGCGRLAVVNLFAYRATKPPNFSLIADPVGPDNDAWITKATDVPGSFVIAAWGAHGSRYPTRIAKVRPLLRGIVQSFPLTKDGQPSHPLMLSYATKLQPWPAGAEGGGP